MDINIKEIEDKILAYLYETRSVSPQSVTKIKLAIELKDGRGDVRVFKSALQGLIQKDFIKKQEIRGNYKIEIKGIEEIERIEEN